MILRTRALLKARGEGPVRPGLGARPCLPRPGCSPAPPAGSTEAAAGSARASGATAGRWGSGGEAPSAGQGSRRCWWWCARLGLDTRPGSVDTCLVTRKKDLKKKKSIDMTPRTWAKRGKRDRLDFITIKDLCASLYPCREKAAGKIFANHISNKRLISRI